MDLFFAIGLGMLFGFALNRVGATNPENIINMLRLSDLRLMKAILLAIGLSSIGLFGGLALGVVDPSHVSVKTAYIGVVVGGAILGGGFALAGYCPGTGLAAMATGRKDALIFSLGGLLGAFAYMISFEWLGAHTELFETIFGGAVSLAETGNDKYSSLIGVDGTILGLALGAVFVFVSAVLPMRILKG